MHIIGWRTPEPFFALPREVVIPPDTGPQPAATGIRGGIVYDETPCHQRVGEVLDDP